MTSVSQISYITLQVYEHFRGTIFRSILRSKAQLRVKTFVHLHSYNILYTLPGTASIRPDGNTIDLAAPAFAVYSELQSYEKALKPVIAALKKKKKGMYSSQAVTGTL